MKKIGLIGCGNIAETYFKSQNYFNNINFVSCADINLEAAKKCANLYKIKAQTVEGLLSNTDVDIILNLTIPQAHYEIVKKTLLAGKHIYSEKPLSISFAQGKELIKLAKSKNLYLGNAPDTFLGGGGQLSRKLLDAGEIGEVTLGNFIFAFPGVETFHHNPDSWYKEGGGPIIDMGPYFFTMLVHLLGPAKNVQSKAIKVKKYRNIYKGSRKNEKIKVEIPTSYTFNIEFNTGALIQGFISFDVLNHQHNHMELYGTKGSIIVPDPNMFGGPVFLSKDLGSPWVEHSAEKMLIGKTNIQNHSGRSNEASQQSNYRGVGLSEMIYAIENKLKHRCCGNLALHVLDLIESTIKSAETGKEISMQTSCEKPQPFTEEQIKIIFKKK
jgi:predicted dehydrogenase